MLAVRMLVVGISSPSHAQYMQDNRNICIVKQSCENLIDRVKDFFMKFKFVKKKAIHFHFLCFV